MPIRVTSARDGFRRCGVAHPAAPTLHAEGRFSAAEIARMESEPVLFVERLDAAPAGDPPPADLRARVGAAIREVPGRAWTQDGKPKVSAIRAQLGDADFEHVDEALRDEVWAELKASGVAPPEG